MKEKRSFFERLTGAVNLDELETEEVSTHSTHPALSKKGDWPAKEEAEDEGELTVDVYQNANEIIIKAMVAGVKPEDLDINISREMVIIKGRREASREVAEQDYFFKELYWGAFSRTIILPQEVEAEEAEATERNGLLTIRLPKINKMRQTKLKVKSNL